MNKKDTMPAIDEQKSFQDIIGNTVYPKISDAATDAENISREKYKAKKNLIESANDLTTQEKLDAMDKNYDRWNQELWQNILHFTIISFSTVGIAIGGPIAVRNIYKFLTIT